VAACVATVEKVMNYLGSWGIFPTGRRRKGEGALADSESKNIFCGGMLSLSSRVRTVPLAGGPPVIIVKSKPRSYE